MLWLVEGEGWQRRSGPGRPTERRVPALNLGGEWERCSEAVKCSYNKERKRCRREQGTAANAKTTQRECRVLITQYEKRKEDSKEWTGSYPKDNEWVDRVMQPTCSASLEAKTKGRRVGGAIRRNIGTRRGAMRSCLVLVSPAWRIRRALRLGHIIARVREIKLGPAS